MKATQILMDEDRVIEQVLTCLEKLANRCEAGEKLDSTSALEALEFLRNFADRCHHGKEEGHLFPLLEARGLGRQGGPTGLMLHEHEEGHRLIAAMARAVESDARREFVRQARAYVGLTLPGPTREALGAWLAVRGDEPGPLFRPLDRSGRAVA
jgi:hemerythrin-like domain-containing protein